MKKLFAWLLNPPDSGPKATILVRLMAGGVFLWEGVLKFVYPNQGVGRFTKIGIPAPHVMATFVGGLEIVGGILLITGFLTRLIAVPFVIEMLVAMLTTKIALYLGTSPLPLPPAPPRMGPWAVLHEIRSDYAQIMSVLFLLIAGPGAWSLDALLARKRRKSEVGRAGLKIGSVDALPALVRQSGRNA
ncbi:MAG TPA: DoxX family protein [Thermoanaerobaculia bacterium]